MEEDIEVYLQLDLLRNYEVEGVDYYCSLLLEFTIYVDPQITKLLNTGRNLQFGELLFDEQAVELE